MVKVQHPWQIGPTELIEFALERMHKGSDFDRRLAFLILDVGVETLFKTFLTLPEGVVQFHMKRIDRNEAAQGNFHDLLRGIQEANPKKASDFNFAHIEHYHAMRNTLYHLGNQVMAVPTEQVEGYAELAVNLLREYLDVDLSELMIQPKPQPKPDEELVVDSVEVEISTGRFRMERLKSQTIRVVELDADKFVEPVKPFLRDIIVELSLPVKIVNEAGVEKNTRQLGREVISELKPSAWHGWVWGQKIQRDKLVLVLTGRILEGKADQKNWNVVNFILGLKHEILVFRPVGKAKGNSPFNLNCWYTESGEPIKQE